MANRFVRGIIDGSIGSVEELKSAYKSEAKRTHPDVADVVGHEDFLRLRGDYEHALKELSRGGRKPGPLETADAGGMPADIREAAAADPYAAIELLLKRGFPKRPRHRKEILRYNYARLRARSALASISAELPALFDAMEKELLAAREADPRWTDAVVGLLLDFLKAKRSGAAALMAAVRMQCARAFQPAALAPEADDAKRSAEGAASRPGPASAAFFRGLLEARPVQ